MKIVGAQAQRVVAFGRRQLQHRGVRAERAGDPHADMPEPAEADDGDAPARPGIPVPQR